MPTQEAGLNQKLPICQSTDKGNKHGALMYSTDSEIATLYRERMMPVLRAAAKRGRESQVKSAHFELAKASKAIAPYNGKFWRLSDPDQGDPAEVECVCSKCNTFIWIDPLPWFSMFGLGYIVGPTAKCTICPHPVGKPGCRPSTEFWPTDRTLV